LCDAEMIMLMKLSSIVVPARQNMSVELLITFPLFINTLHN